MKDVDRLIINVACIAGSVGCVTGLIIGRATAPATRIVDRVVEKPVYIERQVGAVPQLPQHQIVEHVVRHDDGGFAAGVAAGQALANRPQVVERVVERQVDSTRRYNRAVTVGPNGGQAKAAYGEAVQKLTAPPSPKAKVLTSPSKIAAEERRVRADLKAQGVSEGIRNATVRDMKDSGLLRDRRPVTTAAPTYTRSVTRPVAAPATFSRPASTTSTRSTSSGGSWGFGSSSTRSSSGSSWGSGSSSTRSSSSSSSSSSSTRSSSSSSRR